MGNETNKNQSVIETSSREEKVIAPAQVRPGMLESLSAMMDDETDALEVRRVVKDLESSPELLSHWRRYHAVRAALQQDVHSRPQVDLLAAVKAGLADAPAHAGGPLMRKAGFAVQALRWSGQALVAASVAAAVLVAYPALQGSKPQSNAAVAQQNVPQAQQQGALPQFSGDYNASPLTRTVSLDDAARNRLEKAVRNFSGTAAVLNSNTMPMLANQLEPFSPANSQPAGQQDPRK